MSLSIIREVFANVTAGLLRSQTEPEIFAVSDPGNLREVEKYKQNLDISIFTAKIKAGLKSDFLSSIIIHYISPKGEQLLAGDMADPVSSLRPQGPEPGQQAVNQTFIQASLPGVKVLFVTAGDNSIWTENHS